MLNAPPVPALPAILLVLVPVLGWGPAANAASWRLSTELLLLPLMNDENCCCCIDCGCC
jgi:hypothetical protein